MADSQAERNPSRSGRTAAGGSCSGVERSTGKSATAVALAVAQYPVVDAEEKLDALATEDDAEDGTASCGAGAGGCFPPCSGWPGMLGRLRQAQSLYFTRSPS